MKHASAPAMRWKIPAADRSSETAGWCLPATANMKTSTAASVSAAKNTCGQKNGEELTHHKGTQTLHTERLVLRRFCETDAADIFAWAGNPEVTRYVSYRTHRSVEDSEKILQYWLKGYKREDNYNWAITLDGRKVIGQISVTEHDGLWDAGMGWQIDKPYWNRGYMTEAARAVFEYLFCEIGFHRIYSGHDTRNPASGKVMQKLGMTPEGIARQHYYKAGFGTGDAQKYAILKEEWLDQ